MKLTEELKKQIDDMSYEAMLSKWRFAYTDDSGTSLFSGESGTYYSKVMSEKKDKLNAIEASNASKRISWSAEKK